MKDVQKLLPYFITLIVGFMIAWFIQQSNGGTCDCERMQDRIDYPEGKANKTMGRLTK